MPREEFEDYQVVHNFMHPDEPLKGWINEKNYSNQYTDSWDALMELVEKVESLSYVRGRHFYLNVEQSHVEIKVDRMPNVSFAGTPFGKWGTGGGFGKKIPTYKSCVQFVRWWEAREQLEEALRQSCR